MAMEGIQLPMQALLMRGPFFTMAGRWVMEATLLRDGQPPLQVPFTFAVAAPGEVSGPLNPLTPDPQTLVAGQQVYQTNCVTCHGEGGKGDGPAALGLRPPPSDFAQHMIPGKHTESSPHRGRRFATNCSRSYEWTARQAHSR
jgi:mono/diheme cytochrome c family protein